MSMHFFVCLMALNGTGLIGFFLFPLPFVKRVSRSALCTGGGVARQVYRENDPCDLAPPGGSRVLHPTDPARVYAGLAVWF